jgi:hypothetical protein
MRVWMNMSEGDATGHPGAGGNRSPRRARHVIHRLGGWCRRIAPRQYAHATGPLANGDASVCGSWLPPGSPRPRSA